MKRLIKWFFSLFRNQKQSEIVKQEKVKTVPDGRVLEIKSKPLKNSIEYWKSVKQILETK